MQKFQYHEKAANFYENKLKVAMILALACVVINFIALPALGLELPPMEDLLDGRMTEAEEMGVIFTVTLLVIIICSFFDMLSAGKVCRRIRFSEIEVDSDCVLVSYSSPQTRGLSSEKAFIQLKYSEIVSVEYDDEYEKGQTENLTLKHKNGIVSVCIANPKRAADMIVAGMNGKELSAIENITDDPFGSTQKWMCRVCPHCEKEIEFPIGQKNFSCPWCCNEIEL